MASMAEQFGLEPVEPTNGRSMAEQFGLEPVQQPLSKTEAELTDKLDRVEQGTSLLGAAERLVNDIADSKSSGFLGDMGRKFLAGGAGLVDSAVQAGKYLGVPGAEKTAPLTADLAEYWTGKDGSKLSPEQQAADKGVSDFLEGKGGWMNLADPRAIAGLTAQSLPYMIPGIGGAAVASRLGAGTKAAATLAGVSEGVVGGVSGAAQAGESVEKVPEAKLQQVPAYREFLAEFKTPERARKAMAKAAAQDAGLATGLLTALLGAPAGAVYSRLLGGEGGHILRRLLIGGATEMAEEAGQSTAETIVQNKVTQDYIDPSQSLTEGAGRAAAVGAVAAAPLGAAVGAASPANPDQPEDAPPDDRAPQKDPVEQRLQRARARLDEVLKRPPSEAQQQEARALALRIRDLEAELVATNPNAVPGPTLPDRMPAGAAEAGVRADEEAAEPGNAANISARYPNIDDQGRRYRNFTSGGVVDDAETLDPYTDRVYPKEQPIEVRQSPVEQVEVAPPPPDNRSLTQQEAERLMAALEADLNAPPRAAPEVTEQSLPVERIEAAPPPDEPPDDASGGVPTNIDVAEIEQITAAPAPLQPMLPPPQRTGVYEVTPEGVARELTETDLSARVQAKNTDGLVRIPKGAQFDTSDAKLRAPGPTSFDIYQAKLDRFEQAKAEVAMERSKKAVEAHRKASKIKPSKDGLLAAIAKAGGLNRAQAERAGIDPAEFSRKGWRNRLVFTDNGKTLEAMSEHLAEWGYPVTDADGYGENAMLDALDRALRGEAMGAVPEVNVPEAPQEETADPFGEAFLVDEEYDDFDTAGQRAIMDAAAEAREAGVSEDDIEAIVERGAIRGQSNDDIAATLRQRGRDVGAAQAQGEQGQGPRPGQAQEADAQGAADAAIAPYTQADLDAREQQQRDADAARQAADRKADADAQRDDFLLTGSNRDADEAAARGQDTLFARRAKGEDKRDLVITHNLTAGNIIHAAKMGGIPVPSLAITKVDSPLEDFGEITLIGDVDMADPQGYARTKVFGSDAYSPRYPSVEYKVDSRVEKALRARFGDAAEAVGARSRDGFEEIERRGPDDIANSAAGMYQFLTEQGEQPAVVTRSRLDGPQIAMIEGPLARWVGTRDYQTLGRDPEFQTAVLDELNRQVTEAAGLSAEDAASMMFDPADADVRRNLGMKYAKLVEIHAEEGTQPRPDEYATRNALRTQIEERGLTDEFDQWIDRVWRGLNVEERIFQGFTNAGNRRYKAHTLDNVVAIMKKNLRGGESFNYGAGSVRAKITPQFKSVAAIRKAKGQLVTAEQMKAVKDETNEDLAALGRTVGRLFRLDSSNEFIATDRGTEFISDVGSMGWSRALREWAQDGDLISDDLRADINEFLTKLRNAPTEYFEALIPREVDLSEFKVAVVPKGADKRAIKALEDRGVKIAYYDKGKDGDRARVVKDAAETAASKSLLFARRDNRAANRWIEVTDTANGPMFISKTLTLWPAYKYPNVWKTTGYWVLDENNDRIGVVTLRVEDGKITDLHWIRNETETPGFGTNVLAHILANSDTIEIHSILPQARGFWEKAGSYGYTGEADKPNATLDWDAFSRAADVRRLGEGAGQAAEAPAGRSGQADRGRAPQVKKAPGRGLSISGLRETLGKRLGKKAVQKLEDDGTLVITDSTDADLPDDAKQAIGAGDDVYGFTHDGKVYLIADNLTEGGPVTVDGQLLEDAFAIFLHELGVHHGLPEMLGDKLFADVLTTVKAAMKGDSRLGQAARRARAQVHPDTNPKHVDEEVVAWIVTDRANHDLPLVRRIMARLRAFLVKLGFTKALDPDALVYLARGAAMKAAGRTTASKSAFAAMRDSVMRGQPLFARRKEETPQWRMSGTRREGRARDRSGTYRGHDMTVARYRGNGGIPEWHWTVEKDGRVIANGKEFDVTAAKQAAEKAASVGDSTPLFARRQNVTDTEAFQVWFKDSKVVDENGEPLVVYRSNAVDAVLSGKTQAPESGMDGLRGNAELLSKLLISPTFRAEGLGGFDAPTQRVVLAAVRSFGLNPKVLRSVVELVPVDVVNILAGQKISADSLFRNEAVLKKLLAADGDSSVSAAIDVADALVSAVAGVTTEGFSIPGDSVGAFLDRAPAGGAGKVNVFLSTHGDKLQAVDAGIVPNKSSATGNRGTFDPGNPDIRFARRQENESGWVSEQDAETQETLRKAGVWRQHRSLGERVKEWAQEWPKRVRQGIVDQFDPIKEVDYKAYMLARLSKGSDAALEALMHYGTLTMDKDGAIDVDFEKGGFLEFMRELGGEHERFLAWVIGRRAERLLAEGREHNFTPEDVERLKALSQGTMKDGRDRDLAYLKANTELQRYNKNILDIAERAGLIDAEIRPLWEKDFYIPFYRQMEDDSVKGPVKSGGLVRQYAFKVLKGGAQEIGDPLHNVLRNWAHLIDASLKNNAAVETLTTAENLGIARETTADEKGAVFVMKDGKKVYYAVDDPFLLDAVNALGFSGFSGRFMKIMQASKRYLTLGVTVNPTFRIRNIIRDSISAAGTTKVGYNILGNVISGWRGTHEGSKEFASILAGGGVMRFGTFLEGDRAEHAKRLIEKGVDPDTILNSQKKVKGMLQAAWDYWQHLGDRAENVNRAALYKKLRKEGKSHLEASYQARDLMDFSMQGSWAAIRFLTQTVPFMNARLQGLYKLGRGAKEDPRRFAAVLGATAAASMLLLLQYRDDDDWKQREDWDRETYWWFKIGDKAYRIPKPFEIGVMASIAERGLETLLSDEMNGEQFAARLWHMVSQELSLNPTPQLVGPLIEVWANRDAFTDRPIETMGMERLSKESRVGPYTSATAELVGKVTGKGGLSPVQIDHIIQGYFGWLGATATGMVDLAVRPVTGAPEKPSWRLDDYPVVGDFVKELPAYQSRYLTKFYEESRKVQEAMADLRNYQKIGAMEKAAEVLEQEKDKLQLYKLYTRAQRELSKLNAEIRRVQMSKGRPEEKRERLDQLYLQRNRLAKLTVERTRPGQ